MEKKLSINLLQLCVYYFFIINKFVLFFTLQILQTKFELHQHNTCKNVLKLLDEV